MNSEEDFSLNGIQIIPINIENILENTEFYNNTLLEGETALNSIKKEINKELTTEGTLGFSITPSDLHHNEAHNMLFTNYTPVVNETLPVLADLGTSSSKNESAWIISLVFVIFVIFLTFIGYYLLKKVRRNIKKKQDDSERNMVEMKPLNN